MKPYHSLHLKFLHNSRDILAWDCLTELMRARGCSAKLIVTDALIYYAREMSESDMLTYDEKALAEKFGKSIAEAVKAELTGFAPATVDSQTVHIADEPENGAVEAQSAADSSDADPGIGLADIDWDFLGVTGV